jgi:hypothetical protein
MKHFFPWLTALLAIVFGSVLLLQLLAWATLQDPRLEGVDYLYAVLGKFFGLRAIPTAIVGAAAIVLGLAGMLHRVFLAEGDMREQKEALPAFWAALGIGTVAVLGLLIAVNYFSLQAGQVTSISRWTNCWGDPSGGSK